MMIDELQDRQLCARCFFSSNAVPGVRPEDKLVLQNRRTVVVNACLVLEKCQFDIFGGDELTYISRASKGVLILTRGISESRELLLASRWVPLICYV
jgi:hypothetical protein